MELKVRDRHDADRDDRVKGDVPHDEDRTRRRLAANAGRGYAYFA
jgi:hypothetical protein